MLTGGGPSNNERVGLTADVGVGGTAVKVAKTARGCVVTVGALPGVHVGGSVLAPTTVARGSGVAVPATDVLGVAVGATPGVHDGGKVRTTNDCSVGVTGVTVGAGVALGVGLQAVTAANPTSTASMRKLPLINPHPHPMIEPSSYDLGLLQLSLNFSLNLKNVPFSVLA